MRTLIVFGILVFAASASYGQARPIRGQQSPYPPSSGSAVFILDLGAGVPTSLNDLFKKSTLVVDGEVQEVLPARVMSHRLETDVKIRINTCLKGSLPTQTVVVAQNGGSIGGYTEHTAQYDLMRAGERYIWFLSEDDRPSIAIAGARRMLPTGIWVGLFKVLADNTLNLPTATPAPLRQVYHKASLDQLLRDINLAAATP
jgi:hypothetical protein